MTPHLAFRRSPLHSSQFPIEGWVTNVATSHGLQKSLSVAAGGRSRDPGLHSLKAACVAQGRSTTSAPGSPHVADDDLDAASVRFGDKEPDMV